MYKSAKIVGPTAKPVTVTCLRREMGSVCVMPVGPLVAEQQTRNKIMEVGSGFRRGCRRLIWDNVHASLAVFPEWCPTTLVEERA